MFDDLESRQAYLDSRDNWARFRLDEYPPHIPEYLEGKSLAFWAGYTTRAAGIYAVHCPYADEEVEWNDGIDTAELTIAGRPMAKKDRQKKSEEVGGFIHPDRFGKDHWDTLLYVETRNVDDGRFLDKRQLRANPVRHPLHAVNENSAPWQDSYSTKLRDGVAVIGHDDWDVLNDLENSGVLEVFSEATACVILTNLGWKLAAELRKYRGTATAGTRKFIPSPRVSANMRTAFEKAMKPV